MGTGLTFAYLYWSLKEGNISVCEGPYVEKSLIIGKRKFYLKLGKKFLLKVLSKAIPTYVMSGFLLPVNVIHSLNSMVLQFFWGG